MDRHRALTGPLCTLWASVPDRLAAVVLANATSGPAVATVAADLVALVAEREPVVPADWAPLGEADPALLELTGPWYWGAAPFALHLGRDRHLELRTLGGPGRTASFRPAPDGTWTGQDGYYDGETLRVVRDREGGVSHLDVGSFVFTRQPYGDGPVPGDVDAQGWQAGGG